MGSVKWRVKGMGRPNSAVPHLHYRCVGRPIPRPPARSKDISLAVEWNGAAAEPVLHGTDSRVAVAHCWPAADLRIEPNNRS